MTTAQEGNAEFFRGRRVVVTGGAGFIGSNLAIRLCQLGADVVIFDCLLPGSGANEANLATIREQVTFVVGDLRDLGALREVIAGADLIFNLAGQISHVRSMREPFLDHAINCLGHLNLVEVWRQTAPQAKVVYAGTRQQYGRPQYLPIDEKHPLTLSDVNAIHKTAAESYHLLYARVYGLQAVSLRLTNTYGPRMLIRTADQTFLGWFVNRAMMGHTIELFGDGMQRRDLTFVDDAVDAMLLAAALPQANGEVFNVSGPRPLTLFDIAQLTVAAVGNGDCRRVPFPEERKKIDIGDAYSDGSKLTAVLGWQPKTSLEEGLRQTVAFYRSNWEQYA